MKGCEFINLILHTHIHTNTHTHTPSYNLPSQEEVAVVVNKTLQSKVTERRFYSLIFFTF